AHLTETPPPPLTSPTYLPPRRRTLPAPRFPQQKLVKLEESAIPTPVDSNSVVEAVNYATKPIPPSSPPPCIPRNKFMATATMATAAGAAALLYYTLNRKLQTGEESHRDDDDENDSVTATRMQLGINRVSSRLIQAPGTWLETISTLSETLRFTYSETLGKWPITDLAFGINFLLKRQGNLLVAEVFGGKDSLQLKGPEIAAELKYLLHLLTLCWHFSKKPFPIFLEETGFSEENVLLQEPKAGILKPAFTVLLDHPTKQFLLLIRGTHSVKDTLTAATGAVVPFHHTVVNEGGVSNLVLGYAHCGMVAAARWISKLAIPCLKDALSLYPDYKLKIVGHSLGGGTAALLTYVMREQNEFSTTTCVTFAPAACMTWELAESGNDFITSVINGADLVPTFSAASIDDLRAEVTASAWINDLRNQIERTRILSTVYRSASALGSRLPTIASAKAKVAGAGAILRPVSNGTQVTSSMFCFWTTRPALSLSSWSCIGPRQRTTTAHLNPEEGSPPHSPSRTETSRPLLSPMKNTETSVIEDIDITLSTCGEQWTSEIDYSCTDEPAQRVDGQPNEDDDVAEHMSDTQECLNEEHELYDGMEGEGDGEGLNEIREEEAEAIAEAGEDGAETSVPQTKEVHRFFPAGKIMHIVTYPIEDENTDNGSDNSKPPLETRIGIFLTQRSLYSKVRLSQSMISDHFMPVYRRQIEKVIQEVEKDEAPRHDCQDSGHMI
ncbi:Diacylglycerol lipase-alpha, partial [Linum perenne]